jgi:predicted MFS family arabinose efflux permease
MRSVVVTPAVATRMRAVRGRLAPLGVWPFSRLLSSYTLNELGDSVGVVALAVLVYDRTHAVAATSAFFIVAKFLPALLAPALTARLDQVALRRSLPALYVLEGLAFAALAVIAETRFVLSLVLLLGLLDGTLAITGRGLTRGAVGAVLESAGMLKEGNALMNMGFALASVFGAALAGLLVSSLGIGTALLVDAASFLAIALLVASTSGLPQVESEDEREGWLTHLRAGLSFARSHRPVRLLLTGQALALVMFTVVVPIEVIYAKVSLGTTDAGFGILLASWGAGILIGSLLYLVLKQRSLMGLIIASTAAVGVAYLGMALAGTLGLACAFSVLGGTGNGVQWIAVMTALQEATPRALQARVTGLLESLGAAMPGVGYVLGGALVSVGSPRTAYWVAGAGVMVLVVVLAAGRARLERRDETPRPVQRAGDLPLPDPLSAASAYDAER